MVVCKAHVTFGGFSVSHLKTETERVCSVHSITTIIKVNVLILFLFKQLKFQIRYVTRIAFISVFGLNGVFGYTKSNTKIYTCLSLHFKVYSI